MEPVEVAIVGGGPVGMGLALDLALRGVRSVVLERHLEPQRIPKGQNLTQRTGEHFRAWGVSEAIRAASPIPPSFGNEGLTAYGSILSGYHYDWFKRASVRAFYAADNERLPQYEMERVLRARAAELDDIELMLGWRAEAVQEQPDGVLVHARRRDGRALTVRASYVVGCDGAHSTVRDSAGLTETLDPRGKLMALLVFRSEALHELLESRFPGKTIFNALHPDLEGYWQFLGRVDLNGHWFFHAPTTPETLADEDAVRGLLYEAVGARFEAEFDYIGQWTLRFAHADSYRSGRVFIAGDAAHSHPPYGGYGVNTGLEDARNLSWKLAATLQRWGGGTLLDSYTAERHPVFASTRDHFIARMIDEDATFVESYRPEDDLVAFEAAWSARATQGQAEVQHFVPNYAGSPIVWSLADARPGALGRHKHEATAGYHLSPQPLSDGRDSHDALGAGFSLILVGASASTADEFLAAAGRLGVPLTVLHTDHDANTARWRSRTILVRPDEFVAFARDEPPDSADVVLRRAVG